MKFWTLSLAGVLFLFVGTPAGYALSFVFSQADCQLAGPGCVAGVRSGWGKIAYFQGATKELNDGLRHLAQDVKPNTDFIVRLHAHPQVISLPLEEEPAIRGDEGEPSHDQRSVRVDWSVWSGRNLLLGLENRSNPFEIRVAIFDWQKEKHRESVVPFRPRSENQVVVDVWASETINLAAIDLPDCFTVEQVAERASESAE